ncbi:hypothetical protein I4U23_019410 [Adineta vaga]|nr:hypothetical protein I4U23_019410 [Adineta vaga]
MDDDDELSEYPTNHVHLQSCQICERQFNIEILKKHQAICRKVSNKKRRVFDAGKQRATGSDVPYKATKCTAQIYNGEVPEQNERTKGKSKPNWREKHQRLVQSIREARSVTQAIKEGAPLPAFRPSEVPSDYVSCPYCHRNFNEHVAERHIPFCQTQHERKHIQSSSKPKQQLDRGRTVPPQHFSAHKHQPSNDDMYSNSHDVYKNGYKPSKSAPMRTRQIPTEYQTLSIPPKTSSNGRGGYRKLFGPNSNEESNLTTNYYPAHNEDNYESSFHRPVQRPVLMRTGRTQENTNLNVRARYKNDDVNVYMRRLAPVPTAPSSYGQIQYHNGNSQQNPSRPTAIGRLPVSYGNRCNDCGNTYRIATARFCSECGSKR